MSKLRVIPLVITALAVLICLALVWSAEYKPTPASTPSLTATKAPSATSEAVATNAPKPERTPSYTPTASPTATATPKWATSAPTATQSATPTATQTVAPVWDVPRDKGKDNEPVCEFQVFVTFTPAPPWSTRPAP